MREKGGTWMSKGNIAFANLRAEMARFNITIKEIADAICVNSDTAGNKLSRKTPITLSEAFIIANTFFPDMEVTYLFSELSISNTS